MRFYLGTHQPQWLSRVDVPLFVSRARLAGRKTFPRARTEWALDSGGFTEITRFGGWRITARQYAAEVQHFQDEIGAMDWAAPQDWMCETLALEATGLDVDAHIRRTVDNLVELRTIAPWLPIVPVVQGFALDDYRRCCDAYDTAGIDLARERIVGLGSVCRRQGTEEAASIVFGVAHHVPGIRLHGFGFKVGGIDLARHALASTDSMAWSFAARRKPPLPGCNGHINCANCLRFALQWRSDLLARPSVATQIPLC